MVGKLSVIPVVLTEVAGVARRFLAVDSLRLNALQSIYHRAPCPAVLRCFFAENDCSAVDLTRRPLVAGYHPNKACNKSYKT